MHVEGELGGRGWRVWGGGGMSGMTVTLAWGVEM